MSLVHPLTSHSGYGVTQLALSYTDDFKAAAMVYPMLDPKDDVFSKPTGPDEPTSLRLDRALIPSRDDTLAWIEQRLRELHTKEDLSISPFCVSSCHHGLLTSHVFDSKDRRKREYYPLERIEDGGRLPSTVWVTHGDDDSTVPSRCSDRLQALVGDKLPGTKLRYDVVPGADHGFDFDLKRWEYFADEALGFIKKGWLS